MAPNFRLKEAAVRAAKGAREADQNRKNNAFGPRPHAEPTGLTVEDRNRHEGVIPQWRRPGLSNTSRT